MKTVAQTKTELQPIDPTCDALVPHQSTLQSLLNGHASV